jgi:hypothetical protein
MKRPPSLVSLKRRNVHAAAKWVSAMRGYANLCADYDALRTAAYRELCDLKESTLRAKIEYLNRAIAAAQRTRRLPRLD